MAYPDASASRPSAIHKQTAFRGMSFCLDNERQMIYMMTNFKINIHVTRSSLIASMKKAISIVIVTMLMISLVGCGDSSDNTTAQTSGNKENRMTTEEEMSTQEEAGNPIDEPNQEIDEGVNLPSDIEEDDTEEPATEAADDSQPQGKYTYTIYDGVELSMDVNVDDWIAPNNSGDSFFRIYDLIDDLGWEGINPDEDGYSNIFEYKTGEGPVVKFELGVYNDEYAEGWEDYKFDISSTREVAEYGIGGAFGAAASRDEIILISYLLWEPTAYGEKTYIYPLFDSYMGSFSNVADYYIR